MSTSGSKSNEHVAHFLVDIHIQKMNNIRECVTETVNAELVFL